MKAIDTLFLRVHLRLVRDLRQHVTYQGSLFDDLEVALIDSLRSRSAKPLRVYLDGLPEPLYTDPYFYKVYAQLRDFAKRHIFTNDIYTDKELDIRTNDKFLEVQRDISTPKELTLRSKIVLRQARKLVKEVLGVYDAEEHMAKCRFSVNACKGFPLERAQLYQKLSGPLTGSHCHLEWFQKNYLPTDPLLSDILHEVEYVEIEALDVFNVPKSYKIKRGISPNTLVGSFHSYGLGKMIEHRLEERAGISLSRQPELHKILARKASKTRRLVTADLSSASHCFTSPLINMMVPRPWFKELNRGRLSQVTLDGKCYYQHSFMAMGIGFTFPLQTLLFWSILRAIQTLTRTKGRISVFGDDLIYPRQMHPFVVSILSDIGFSLNVEKTFEKEMFRESCGGDFCRGVDVRPAMPEGNSCTGKIDFALECIKIANALTTRWTYHEISATLILLIKEAAGTLGYVPLCPEDFPDYSGFKRCYGLIPDWLLAPKIYDTNLYCYLFPCITMTQQKEYVPTIIGYYWDKLRAMSTVEDSAVTPDELLRQSRLLPEQLSKGPLYGSVRDVLTWSKKRPKNRRQPKNYRSNRTGCRLKITWPYTTTKRGKSIVTFKQAISILAS